MTNSYDNNEGVIVIQTIRQNKSKYYWIVVTMILLLIISVICVASIGAFKVDIKTTYEILAYKLLGIGKENAEILTGNSNFNVIWAIRFPRVLLGAVVGAGLALSGCVMQACVQNPLAEPYILGISSGAPWARPSLLC